MKNKKGGAGTTTLVIILIAMLTFSVIGIGAYMVFGTENKAVETPEGIPETLIATGSCEQNPAVTPLAVNSFTKQSVTSNILNFVDTATNSLIGSGASLSLGQKVKPVLNASGYLIKALPEYTVKCGAQNLPTAKLDQQANATITIYADSGIAQIGGATSATGNDTTFTSSHNNKIKLVGTTYMSTGRMFVVYETSTTANVSSATLAGPIGYGIKQVTVPNCYTNGVTGTPFRAAWELDPIENGGVVELNLQTTSASGNIVQGEADFVVYNEQDGVDSLTGEILTSGICDSNNRFFGYGGVIGGAGAPASTSVAVGQVNIWYWL